MTLSKHPPIHFRIIAPMTETYASKRERWQKLLDALPPNLRGHISLRNVEAVSSLAPQAQETLAQAIQAGLKRLPRAIELLENTPGLSVAELLEKVSAARDLTGEPVPNADTRRRLADLVQFCYPDMLRLSAEALCEAETLFGVLQVFSAQEIWFTSPHLNADLFGCCFSYPFWRLRICSI